MEKAFITGCDHTGEWLLPWFVKNYRMYNSLPLLFVDFGVKEKHKLELMFDQVLPLCDTKENGWFKKPAAMLTSPAQKTIWLDTDCEVLSNIEELFDMLVSDKLSMVDDVPWTRRKKEKWYNSGVVGFIGKPAILQDWRSAVQKRPRRGDQETLHDIDRKGNHIHELPQEYNWLRVTLENDRQDSKDKKIMHWTGPRGKQRIRDKIKTK